MGIGFTRVRDIAANRSPASFSRTISRRERARDRSLGTLRWGRARFKHPQSESASQRDRIRHDSVQLRLRLARRANQIDGGNRPGTSVIPKRGRNALLRAYCLYEQTSPIRPDPHESCSWVNQMVGYEHTSPIRPDPHELARG